jgi:hypothetical protein
MSSIAADRRANEVLELALRRRGLPACPPGTSCRALERQRGLDIKPPGGVGADEALQGVRDIVVSVCSAPGQRVGDVGSRVVAGPSFARVEAHDPDRIDVLPEEEACIAGLVLLWMNLRAFGETEPTSLRRIVVSRLGLTRSRINAQHGHQS